MKVRIERFFSSYVTTVVLLAVYAAGLAAATLIEKYHGTPAAKGMVYYSPWFFLLQFLMAVNFVAAAVRHRLFKRKKWGMMMVHSAFLIMLGGAFVSHLSGQEGILHLREGETSNRMAVHTSQGDYFHILPFSVELEDFILTRYPGSASPSSFESELLVHIDGEVRRERVYMNNVLDVKGYRFFQASFDRDEQGTVLSVNRDVAGRNLTYAGYLLLGLGLVFSLLEKNSRFRYLSRRLKEMHAAAGMAGLLLLAGALPLQAGEKTSPMLEAVQKYAVDPGHAALFAALPVQSGNGRMIPVNTFSSEILRKLHQSDRIGRLNSDQFLISLLTMPDMWMRVPFIALPDNGLARFFDLTEDECAYIEVFDSAGNYKFQQRLDEAYNKMPAERSRFDKDLIKLDEKVNIMYQLLNHQLLNLFPREDDPDSRWYAAGDDLSGFSGKDSLFVSQIIPWYLGEVQTALKSGDWSKAGELTGMIQTYQQAKNKTIEINPKRLRTEIRYNRLNPFRTCKKGYLILGGMLLVLSFAALFKPANRLKYGIRALGAGVLVVFHFHMIGMTMRGYIAGYAPWSNSYETMVYVAWATVLAGLLFARRSAITFALATIFAGVILFVSGLNWMDPAINPLVPVLQSPWLMFHVSVIMAAYGFFGIGFLIGTTNLGLMSFGSSLRSRISELTVINEMCLWIGLALMTAGTFLGAVWANESWGRYWGWDPKETWALITVVVYALTLHLRLVKRWDKPWLFNLMAVLSFAAVLMTYFGVNYLLGGMHAYGNN